jgi:rhamnulokinase
MFTNEWGVGGRIRFLKNIAGLWLIQELRRDLASAGEAYDYPRLIELAQGSEPFRAIVDANHPTFQSPGGIRQKIATLCQQSKQPVPRSAGEFARCCLESLAVAYRRTFGKLRRVLAQDFECVHIVGGGGQNHLLCQMTADALQRRVVVGPFEATAIGNGLVQAMALSRIADLQEMRSRVADSVPLQTYQPHPDKEWEEWE